MRSWFIIFMIISIVNLSVLADDQIGLSGAVTEEVSPIQDMIVTNALAAEETPVTLEELTGSDQVLPHESEDPVLLTSEENLAPDSVEESPVERTDVITKPLEASPAMIANEVVVSDTEQRRVSIDGDIVTIVWK